MLRGLPSWIFSCHIWESSHQTPSCQDSPTPPQKRIRGQYHFFCFKAVGLHDVKCYWTMSIMATKDDLRSGAVGPFFSLNHPQPLMYQHLINFWEKLPCTTSVSTLLFKLRIAEQQNNRKPKPETKEQFKQLAALQDIPTDAWKCEHSFKRNTK